MWCITGPMGPVMHHIFYENEGTSGLLEAKCISITSGSQRLLFFIVTPARAVASLIKNSSALVKELATIKANKEPYFWLLHGK